MRSYLSQRFDRALFQNSNQFCPPAQYPARDPQGVGQLTDSKGQG